MFVPSSDKVSKHWRSCRCGRVGEATSMEGKVIESSKILAIRYSQYAGKPCDFAFFPGTVLPVSMLPLIVFLPDHTLTGEPRA